MTKSYVFGWLAAWLMFAVLSVNASAGEQLPILAGESTEQSIKSESSDAQGLPLYPLAKPDSTENSLHPDDEVIDVNVEGPLLEDNLVELAEPASSARHFVIYVVRHMEKEESILDPGLTSEGLRRADGLAQLLSRAEVERIYSTFYRRSVATALPLARTLAAPVEFYQPDRGAQLVEDLLAARQSALVVGNSNTVAELVTALGGTAEELSEDMYGDIFQLFIRIDEEDEHDVRQVRLKAPLQAADRRGQR